MGRLLVGACPPHGFQSRMRAQAGDEKCASALKSIEAGYRGRSIRTGYRTDWVSAFLTRGDPASDEVSAPLQGGPDRKILLPTAGARHDHAIARQRPSA